MSKPEDAQLVCPRCRRPQAQPDARRCPIDEAFYVTRAALTAAGRDPYMGELIAERYAIIERLGMGGMGAVYRGIDERTGQYVAVKFLREEFTAHKAIRARFVREAEAGVSIQSPYVVGMLDFGVDADRTLYIVMELVQGWTLRDEVNHNGPFSVRHARVLARQVLKGLADAHDVGLIHRDLKHDNIMFTGTRDQFIARVLDFGVVKIDAEDARDDGRVLTAAGAMVGSPSYMAPEQIRGLAVGPPADLYALAVVLYEAMTARRLFPVNNYEALLRSGAKRDAPPLTQTGTGEPVPPAFDRVIQRALATDPNDRFPDARTMLLAIDQMELSDSTMPADLFADSPDLPAPRKAATGPSAEPPPPSPAPAGPQADVETPAVAPVELVAQPTATRAAPRPLVEVPSFIEESVPGVEVLADPAPDAAAHGPGRGVAVLLAAAVVGFVLTRALLAG
jgi:serine/threonine-protein kinase